MLAGSSAGAAIRACSSWSGSRTQWVRKSEPYSSADKSAAAPRSSGALGCRGVFRWCCKATDRYALCAAHSVFDSMQCVGGDPTPSQQDIRLTRDLEGARLRHRRRERPHQPPRDGPAIPALHAVLALVTTEPFRTGIEPHFNINDAIAAYVRFRPIADISAQSSGNDRPIPATDRALDACTKWGFDGRAR